MEGARFSTEHWGWGDGCGGEGPWDGLTAAKSGQFGGNLSAAYILLHKERRREAMYLCICGKKLSRPYYSTLRAITQRWLKKWGLLLSII